ncbi:hypothetical protein [Anaerotalea alkaliphila]|uniref:Uncharacterized protein n=1 Tax=Anaerotalea alkaliphila TaxID=2662126 RepID=A0A7X5HXH5_9FIRM|nr:hypothetical protein [Anaerotalea alkaliphila]NDL68423.1 hypothetical protein [Anaerotalea alkaliphila]
MSLFLAPIHTWLFNKILLLEKIEKEIAGRFQDPDIAATREGLHRTLGGYIPDQPLETMIDTGNIHGWLQSKITLAETRQAALVKQILGKHREAEKEISAIYKEAGRKSGQERGSLEDATEIFQALSDYLLEGMPCDRVNAVVFKSEEEIEWKTANCVHRQNWEGSGVDVAFYYGFRAAFIDGFVEGASRNFSYTYSNEGAQVHRIQKKAA